MKPSNFIITIPEPCHEDWTAMTADKKGKFCSSCSKSVVDFSNKSDTEIKTILIEHKDQKVCGHFKKSQINRPLNISINFNELPKNMSTTKVFAIALFFVFGTMLFSCTNFKGQKIDTIEVVNSNDQNYTLGEMAMVESKTLPEDTTQSTNIKGETICSPESFVNGGIMYQEVPLVLDTPIVNTLVVEDDNTMKGAICVISHPLDKIYTIDSALTKKINTDFDTSNIISKQNDLLIYPNPSKGEFTISYNVLKPTDVRIDIFDQNGALLKTVVNIANQHQGNYQIPVNMEEYVNGIYFVSMLNNSKKTTSKVIVER